MVHNPQGVLKIRRMVLQGRVIYMGSFLGLLKQSHCSHMHENP